MDTLSVCKLLTTISVHYPRFKSQIVDAGGNISKHVAEEWHRHLGFMEYEEALEWFDQYVMQDDGRTAPTIKDFLKAPRRREEPDTPIRREHHTYHLEFLKNDPGHKHGRCFNERGMEYTHDPVYEDGYHYDSMGRICTIDGRIVEAFNR